MKDVLTITIMSGVEDGSSLQFSAEDDGVRGADYWTISIGRRDENDVCLRNDTFVSREHAHIHWRDGRWWLEDCESTNGTFTEDPNDFFSDVRVKGIVPLELGQLFRVGRTWMRIK